MMRWINGHNCIYVTPHPWCVLWGHKSTWLSLPAMWLASRITAPSLNTGGISRKTNAMRRGLTPDWVLILHDSLVARMCPGSQFFMRWPIFHSSQWLNLCLNQSTKSWLQAGSEQGQHLITMTKFKTLPGHMVSQEPEHQFPFWPLQRWSTGARAIKIHGPVGKADGHP